jgi:O-antigen/teichoic acid export membrane protein
MTSSQRLVINTTATYGRAVFSIALLLFSSRWVLNSLGQTDFGLFSVVGSIIVFITLLNNVMAGSVARYYAYSVGRGETREVTYWFNSALMMHLCLATMLTMIGWPIGEYVITHVLTVPGNRIAACLWVFRLSLVSAFVSMISVPCVAMFTAQQRIMETAFWGIMQTMLAFGLAFGLTRMTGDLLLTYAVGMVFIIILIQAMMVLRAFIVFKECRFVLSHCLDAQRFRMIFSFAIWNLIGSMGATLRDQGSAILLNIYFGPSVNSSYGIARRVSTQANQLAAAMLGAFAPEITANEGRGERRHMLTLALRASKFGTILVLLFAIPLMVEMDYILKIWLKEPPLYTAVFCRLILIAFLIDRFTSGFMLAVNAHGRIAAYQATVGGILVMTLPLAWSFLKLGYGPPSIGVAFVLTMIVCSTGRMLWGKHLFGVAVNRWLKAVVWPCVMVGVLTTLVGLIPFYMMPASFIRLMTILAASLIICLLSSWFLALDINERAFMQQNIINVHNKMAGLRLQLASNSKEESSDSKPFALRRSSLSSE